MENYEVSETIGTGTFGSVMKALDTKTQRHVALKCYSEDDDTTANREIKLHKYLLKRPNSEESNIVTYYKSFRSVNRWVLVMELLGQNLFEMLVTIPNGFTLSEMRVITKSVLSGLCFLHSNQVIHADIKIKNIVVKNLLTLECKLVDLGSSVFFHEIQRIHENGQLVQNHYYRAPEIFIQALFNEKIDIFGLGIVLTRLSGKKFLFMESNVRKQLAKMVTYLGYPPRDLVENSRNGKLYFNVNPTTISLRWMPGFPKVKANSKSLATFFEDHNDPDFISFLKQCLDINPATRSSANDLLMHPWIEPDPAERDRLRILQMPTTETARRRRPNSRWRCVVM